jgi:nitrogen fixation/metabolism regulation signal transduction histidine kinase
MGKKEMVTDAPKVIITELDERLFRGNSLATKLFQYFLIMGLLMVILGPALDLVFELLQVEFLFQYLSHSSMVILLLLAFTIYSTVKILRPMKQLLVDIRKLQEGDFDVPLDAKGYTEIESLERSMKRLRNSLMIATELLGERDKSLDKIAVEKISGLSTTFAMIIPFLIYSILLTFLVGIIYSPLIEDPMNGVVPLHGLVQAILVIVAGIGLAFGFGYVVSFMVGNPIHKLAMAAEQVSKGNLDADFSIVSFGDLKELSIRLHDMRDALKRAIEEIEEEGVV